jgi:hypothetical protein
MKYDKHIKILEASKKYLWEGTNYVTNCVSNKQVYVCHAIHEAAKRNARVRIQLKAEISRRLGNEFSSYCNVLSKHKITPENVSCAEIQCQRWMLIQELIDFYTEMNK